MKILVIRFLAIGDVVLSSVLCNSLKKSFPDSQVDYLVHQPSASLFAHHPYIDNVYALTLPQRKNLFKYFKAVKEITSNNYDIIIDASSTEKSSMFSLFSRQAKFKIGRYKPNKGYFFTHKIKYDGRQKDKIQQRLAMLKPLSAAGMNIRLDTQMKINITLQEKHSMRTKMRNRGVSFIKPVFVFSVSSKLDFKKWRREFMVQVIRHCLNELNGQVIFYYWGLEEFNDVKTIHNEYLNHHPDVISNLEISCSRDLATIMANCDMFIGNEGGPRHISQALGLPSVAVFSPSADKLNWLPNACDRYVGIDWKELPENAKHSKARYKNGDKLYYQLYDSITPAHVIPLVNQVFNQHVIVGQSTPELISA